MSKSGIVDDVKSGIFHKGGDFSESKISSRIRSLHDKELSMKWQNIKIKGRGDDSACSHVQFISGPSEEVCGGFSQFIDFSMESSAKLEDCPVLAEGVPKSVYPRLSEKPVAASSEGVEHNLQTDKGIKKVKEESLMEPFLSKGQSNEKCVYTKIFISRRRSVSKEEKDRAFQAAIAVNSSNPSFTVVMRPTHVYRAFYMSIPSSFVRAHLSSRTREMTLEMSDSRQWPVHCTFRKDYAGLRKGWSTFVWDNNLEEGDACVFEHIGGNVFTFRVHVFRVIDEITPLSKSYMPYTPKVPWANRRRCIQQMLDLPLTTGGSTDKPVQS